MIEAIKFKVIVEEDEKPTETNSGLYIGNYNLEGALRRGTVISTGKDVRGGIKAGDKVCFLAGFGRAIEHDGKRYLSLYDTEIEATFTE